MDAEDQDELARLVRQVRGHVAQLAERRVAWVPAAPPRAVAAPVAPATRPAAAPPSSPTPTALALAAVREELGECTRCKLSKTRTKIAFGVGDPDAELVFIGEAPGEQEDLQGEPFVGEAGQLLTKMIEAMGYRRSEVYIGNTLKCRPPGNRNPQPDETSACEPFLVKQLAAMHPKVIVALGKYAAQWLTGKPDAAIGALRGKFHLYNGIKVMPTYHPAYLLRTPTAKRTVWEDLQLVMRELKGG